MSRVYSCIKQNESDTETYFYKPGFSINYNSSISSNSLNTNVENDIFPNENSQKQSIIKNMTDKKTEPDFFYPYHTDKNYDLNDNIKRVSSKESLRSGFSNLFSYNDPTIHAYKQNERLKSTVSSTNAAALVHEQSSNNSKTDSERGCLSIDYQKSVKSNIPHKYHQQRSLSPTSVADRCRIAIKGCGGNTFGIEGHAENKKYKLQQNTMF